MTDLDYGQFEALTFDCYGTLIDWEAGILAGLRRVLARAASSRPTTSCSRYSPGSRPGSRAARTCATARSSGAACARWPPTTRSRRCVAEVAAFADSVGDWPAFPDSVEALERLQFRYRLGVITNCDDDLFARSAARLGTDVRLGRDRAVGPELQARPAQLRGRVRADRAAARTHPPRRPEPLPRPRAGQGARADDGLDRPSRRPARRPARHRRPTPRRTRPSRTWRRSPRRRPRPEASYAGGAVTGRGRHARLPRNAGGASPSRRCCGHARTRPRRRAPPSRDARSRRGSRWRRVR